MKSDQYQILFPSGLNCERLIIQPLENVNHHQSFYFRLLNFHVTPEYINTILVTGCILFIRVTVSFLMWSSCVYLLTHLPLDKNGLHFADDICKCIFFNGNAWILLKILLKQGSTLSFPAGCPKSHFLGWYRNFLVYWYLKLDNQVVNSTCPKDKLGWIWWADDPQCRTLWSVFLRFESTIFQQCFR